MLGEDAQRVGAVLGGLLLPGVGHLGQAAMGLGWPGGEGGGLAEPDDLQRGGMASVIGDEALDQVILGRVDLAGTDREEFEERLGDAGDLPPVPLRMPRRSGFPVDAELLGEEIGQDALVQRGQGGAGLEDRPAVQGPPPTVGGGAGPVPDDHVIVELGVAGPGVEVGERGGDDPVDRLGHDPVSPRPGREHVRLGVTEHDVDGGSVAVVDHLTRRCVR